MSTPLYHEKWVALKWNATPRGTMKAVYVASTRVVKKYQAIAGRDRGWIVGNLHLYLLLAASDSL